MSPGHHEQRRAELPARESEHSHQQRDGCEDERAPSVSSPCEPGGGEVQPPLLEAGGGQDHQPGEV